MAENAYKIYTRALNEAKRSLWESTHPLLVNKKNQPKTGLRIALCVVDHINITDRSYLGRCNPSQDRIVNLLHLSEKCVRDTLHELCHPETGIGITMHKLKAGSRHNHYQYDLTGLHPELPSPWKGDDYIQKVDDDLRSVVQANVLDKRKAELSEEISERLDNFKTNGRGDSISRLVSAKAFEQIVETGRVSIANQRSQLEILEKSHERLKHPKGYENRFAHPVESIAHQFIESNWHSPRFDWNLSSEMTDLERFDEMNRGAI